MPAATTEMICASKVRQGSPQSAELLGSACHAGVGLVPPVDNVERPCTPLRWDKRCGF
jgi:hypothetical protein